MRKLFASAMSWLLRGIDLAGLAVQTALTLGAAGFAGWMLTEYAAQSWLVPAVVILGNALGARIHLRWAVTERPLPRSVVRTLPVRSEGLTLVLCVLVLEGVRALPVAAGALTLIGSARTAFGIAAAAVAGHALISAPAWFADRALTGDPEARITIPQRPPRLRLRSRSGASDA